MLLIGFCGLAIDVGMLELKKVRLQNAADTAVLGAVYEYGRENANWKVGGTADAGLNGFTDGVNNVTVTISNPPTSGSFLNNRNALQATVTQQVGTGFTGSSYTLAAQAVSLLPPSTYLMSLLSPSTSVDTLSVSNSSFTVKCSVYIARDIQSSSSVLQATGCSVVGPSSSSTLSGSTQPAPVFNSAVQKDPLASTPQPVFSSCTFNGPNSQPNRTLSPGTYCNKSINCSAATLTLLPGTYIITGGASWNNCTNISGTSVTPFLTKDSSSNFGQFVVTNSTVSLSAPVNSSSGGIPGILIFMDRAWSGSSLDLEWSGSTYKGDGIWYSTNTGVEISNSQVQGTNYLGIIVNNLTVANSSFNAPYANSPVALAGSSSASAGLAE